MNGRALVGVALVAGVVAGCQPVNPYYDASKPHHTPAGFRNLHGSPQPVSASFLRWHLEQLLRSEPVAPSTPLPSAEIDLPWVQTTESGVRISWVGHGTLLVQAGGFNLLTDPQFSERSSPLSFLGPKRWQAPAIALSDLPHIHAVVISHDHYDSLDLASVRALAEQVGGPPVFIVPLGVDVWFRMNVPAVKDLRPVDWWEQTVVGDVAFTLAPVQHWSGRRPFHRDSTLWGAWAVQWANPDFHFLYGGDFGYSEDLRVLGDKLGPFDLAALPIGGYVPRWLLRRYRMNPMEAIQAHRDLRAKSSVAIRWGSFSMGDERLDRPLRTLENARRYADVSEQEFFAMKHGESRVWTDGLWRVRTPEHSGRPESLP